MKKVLLYSVFIVLASCASKTDYANFKETGLASYYASRFHNRPTASGEYFNQNLFTAAHKKLPFGSEVKVTNLDNGRYVIVRINDRGPFIGDRIIDLSKSAFERIGNLRKGLLKVQIEVL